MYASIQFALVCFFGYTLFYKVHYFLKQNVLESDGLGVLQWYCRENNSTCSPWISREGFEFD